MNVNRNNLAINTNLANNIWHRNFLLPRRATIYPMTQVRVRNMDYLPLLNDVQQRWQPMYTRFAYSTWHELPHVAYSPFPVKQRKNDYFSPRTTLSSTGLSLDNDNPSSQQKTTFAHKILDVSSTHRHKGNLLLSPNSFRAELGASRVAFRNARPVDGKKIIGETVAQPLSGKLAPSNAKYLVQRSTNNTRYSATLQSETPIESEETTQAVARLLPPEFSVSGSDNLRKNILRHRLGIPQFHLSQEPEVSMELISNKMAPSSLLPDQSSPGNSDVAVNMPINQIVRSSLNPKLQRKEYLLTAGNGRKNMQVEQFSQTDVSSEESINASMSMAKVKHDYHFPLILSKPHQINKLNAESRYKSRLIQRQPIVTVSPHLLPSPTHLPLIRLLTNKDQDSQVARGTSTQPQARSDRNLSLEPLVSIIQRQVKTGNSQTTDSEQSTLEFNQPLPTMGHESSRFDTGDISQLADQVSRIILRRILVERERRGLGR